MKKSIMAGLSLGAALVLSAAARADAIDGHWCFKDGGHFSIRGPQIVTPGGNRLLGDYDRHGFAYVVPRGELGAGDEVLMLLQNEMVLHVWHSAPGKSDRGATQVWHRCDPKLS